ncbi:MAG: hypothetical protein ABIJ17_02485 [Patescibacteria group bacterium]
MEWFWKLISSDEVQKLLLSAFLSIISFIGLKFSKFMNEKIKNEKIKDAFQKMYQKISAQVCDIYKSASDDFKNKAKNGDFTQAERKEWRENILNFTKLSCQAELNELKQVGYDSKEIILTHAELAWEEVKKKFY